MEDGRKTTIIIDASHHGMRHISVCKSEDTAEEGYQLWRYKFLSGIFYYISQFKADEVILALDSTNNWRKKYYRFYKESRKNKRKQQDDDDSWFNYSEYFKVFDQLVTDIKDNLPIKVLQVPTTEADDIAGVLCSEAILDNNKILITTDKDYIQLMSNPFTRVYNPQTRVFVEVDDPKKELFKKILIGDKGDDIPSVKDRHVFKPEFLTFCVNEGIADNADLVKVIFEGDEDKMLEMEYKFQQKYPIKAAKVFTLPPKEVNSIVEDDRIQKYLLENKPQRTKFIRNNILINLTAQPKEIREEIKEQYDNYEMSGERTDLLMFFIDYSLTEMIDNITLISRNLGPLYE